MCGGTGTNAQPGKGAVSPQEQPYRQRTGLVLSGSLLHDILIFFVSSLHYVVVVHCLLSAVAMFAADAVVVFVAVVAMSFVVAEDLAESFWWCK